MITCLAPWVHLHIDSQGRQQPCCVGKFTRSYNDELEMHRLRRIFLQGKIPEKICDNCFGDSANRVESERYYLHFNSRYAEYENEIIAKTDARTGKTTFDPVDFDIRTSLCNLSCRTCDSYHSTKIAADEKNVIYLKPIKPDDSLLEKFTAAQKIYWAGGEPLLSPFHWKAMEQLAKDGVFDLSYNTNACVPETYWNRFVTMIDNFKGRTGIFCSSDGFDEIGEFIRPGFQTNLFKSRVAHLKNLFLEKPNNTHLVYVDFTITNLGLFALKNMIEYCAVKNLFLVMKDLLLTPKNFYLSVNVLKPDSFHQIIQEILNSVNDNNSTLADQIRKYCEFLKQEYVYTPWTDTHQKTLEYSLLTKGQNLSDFPKVKEIFDNHIRLTPAY